jgi:nicotinamide-nucleotide amidase
MKTEIVSIGSELVSGQSLDTNSQWLSRSLGVLGVPVHYHTTLADVLDENVAALRIAIDRAEFVVVTGGLGPTQDDLTRDAVAAVAGVPLREDAASLDAIAALFARRNRVMAERNRVQALIPEGAVPLPNRVGTAPGIWMTLGKSTVACLPGVPGEMRIMFEEQVVPRLRELGRLGQVIVHHKINLFGKGESDIEAAALDLTARGRTPEVGITASEATISFRISAAAPTEPEARRALEPTIALIRARFGELVVGDGSVDVADAAVALLMQSGTTLATAESCTGGLIARQITAIPGVSPSFLGGVVSYSNESKVELIDVPAALIDAHGAVSPEVAAAMAAGVRRRLKTDLGLSVTGVAGPTGGTPQKPVGLVYLGLADAVGVETRRLDIGPEQPRDVVQARAAKSALNWVRLYLLRRAGAAH